MGLAGKKKGRAQYPRIFPTFEGERACSIFLVKVVQSGLTVAVGSFLLGSMTQPPVARFDGISVSLPYTRRCSTPNVHRMAKSPPIPVPLTTQGRSQVRGQESATSHAHTVFWRYSTPQTGGTGGLALGEEVWAQWIVVLVGCGRVLLGRPKS